MYIERIRNGLVRILVLLDMITDPAVGYFLEFVVIFIEN